MRRPTIRDLAARAGVSIATVNRVLAGATVVRPATRARVEAAAEAIGFYGLGAIRARNAAARPRYRLGALLLQPHRRWYQLLARALGAAASAVAEAELVVEVEHLVDLAPGHTAERALALAERCDALCLVSAVHPLVSRAVETIRERGKPVLAIVSPLGVTGETAYVGLDNWKVGRTAAWFFARLCPPGAKVALLMGNPRYRCQEMNEAGFRSYLREHGCALRLLEPGLTYESAAVAQELTEALLAEHPDLAGLYMAGGGISGVLEALRIAGPGPGLVTLGYELMDNTREALLDGRLTLVISCPLGRLAREAVDVVLAALRDPSGTANRTRIVPFEIHTRESI
ncbi:MAG: LacI family DNA-binding transcriptional regulator [Geminicoccaceae bacterium]|nr:LacI family DNA-binding transcriptional regulator [Geminicoccaceae bacterium]MDW8371398.1 LacI family DNA-binding transcriptional regulator [Geminicoccaceae bacterium]